MTTPTPEDDVKQLRDALALGPQAWDYDSNMRPFYNDPEGNSRGGECDGTYTLYGADFDIDGETYEGPTLSERCKIADAKFIAAANPARIARLLDHIEALERDKVRLDWLETQKTGYGFQDIHEGNRWEVFGAYANVREAIDSERAAIASEAKP